MIEESAKNQLVFPYIYGSLSFSMGKKASDTSYTHKWICYVRGLHNQDLSYLIKKVVFQLHQSFQNPIKQVYSPPYQIQELGWGQFQILIRIHFNHPNMPPIQIPHMLKLHHSPNSQGGSKKPLCSEVYDQIVFPDPDEQIIKIMQKRKELQQSHIVVEEPIQQQNQLATAQQPLKSITQYSKFLTVIDSQDHKNKLEDALRFIKGQIISLQQKMRIADIDIQKVYEDLYSKIQ